ncbi:MAG: hypothetical protein HAW65_02505 [Alphaproteobacteria bacterium]|nr:hypothetical protein [Alphaproteobacteria bacterium]MBE8220162.1 hypothetical protein [Alphaproteobacteria bacterium]
MRRIITLLVFFLLCVPVSFFAIENSTLIKIDLNPFDFFSPMVTQLTTLPLSAALLFAFLIAFLAGLFLGLLSSRFRS